MLKRLPGIVALFALCALSTLSAAADADAPAGNADAAAIASLPNPLRNAAVGQWVQYRIATLFGSAEQKQTIVAVEGDGDERVLTIKSEMTIDDELVDERTDSVTYKQALEEQKRALGDVENIRITSTTLDFKGAAYDIVEVNFVQDDQKCVLYLSEKVPLVGMVRMTIEDQEEPAMELIDFGE